MYKKDQSYGVIPLKKFQNTWHVLLVQHSGKHWAFPKGHADEGESPQEAAVRELFEETGLIADSFLEIEPLEEKYKFQFKGNLIDKTVIYFPAEVSGKVIIQEDEISDAKWCTLEDAEKLATFPASKQLCQSLRTQLFK